MSDLLIDLRKIPFSPRVRGVIHVGAHKAEEYETYKAIGAESIIYIECNSDLVVELEKRFKEHSDVRVVQATIFDKETEAVLKIHNDTHTTSLLDMAKMAENHPELVVERTEEVSTVSLNYLVKILGVNLTKYNLLTIDVQGVELQALKGAEEIIDAFDYVYTEVETWELYKDSINYEEIKKWLGDHGFEMVTEHIRHWGWGDVLFKRIR